MTDTDQLPDLADTLELWEQLHQDDRDPSAGPSDVGRCRRQTGYRVLRTEPDDEYEDDRSAAVAGSLVHLAVATVRAKLYPAALVEHPVRAPGLEREGTLDAYAGGIVDDVKSASCHVWDRIVGSGQPRPGDLDQLGLYALGLEDAGHQVTELTVSYYNRCTGTVWTTRTPWTTDQRRAALAGLFRLHAVLDAADAGKLLPRDQPHPGTRTCELCPFRRRCWELDSQPAEHVGPHTAYAETAAERLEAIAAMDDDERAAVEDYLPPPLEEAARRHLELGELQQQLEDERRAIAQQLRGWQDARLTDAAGVVRRVAWTRPGPSRMVDDTEAAAELLRQLGHDVPQKQSKPTSAALYLRPLPKTKPRKAKRTGATP